MWHCLLWILLFWLFFPCPWWVILNFLQHFPSLRCLGFFFFFFEWVRVTGVNLCFEWFNVVPSYFFYLDWSSSCSCDAVSLGLFPCILLVVLSLYLGRYFFPARSLGLVRHVWSFGCHGDSMGCDTVHFNDTLLIDWHSMWFIVRSLELLLLANLRCKMLFEAWNNLRLKEENLWLDFECSGTLFSSISGRPE